MLLYREIIEEQTHHNWEWKENPGRKESHISLHFSGVDPLDRQRWPEYQVWLADKLEPFDQVFRPRIKQMNAEDYDPEVENLV